MRLLSGRPRRCAVVIDRLRRAAGPGCDRPGPLVAILGILWLAPLALSVPAYAQVYSSGLATVTLAGGIEHLPLFVLPRNGGVSGVQFDADGRLLLGLDFGELRHGTMETSVHLTVDQVHGPGRYGNAQIGALSMMYAAGSETWLYDPRLNACTCTLTKLDGDGVEGTISCAVSRANRPPFGTIRFKAAP